MFDSPQPNPRRCACESFETERTTKRFDIDLYSLENPSRPEPGQDGASSW